MATEKQKAVARKILEKPGSVSAAMVEVGYKPSTAHNPSDLTNSKGWKELMEKYYPDDKITKIQNKLLESPLLRIMEFDYEMADKIIKKIIRDSGGKVSVIQTYEPIKAKIDEKTGLPKGNDMPGSKKVYYTVPDRKIIDSSVDMILKSKGRYVQKIEVEDKRKYGKISDEDLLAVASGEKEIEEVVND